MTKTIAYRIVAAFLVALAAGCAADAEQGLGESTGSVCPPDSTLTYESFGQSFIESHCAKCHEGRESPRLATQVDVQSSIDLIDRAAAAGPDAANTYMPEDGSVSTTEREELGEWLACGAP